LKYLLNSLLLLCLVAQAMAQGAQTVYRTVDESGVVSFSDTPPEDDEAVETLTLDVAPPPDPAVYQQNLEAMRATTDRMAEDRRAREKHRAEMRERAADPVPQTAQPQNLLEQYSTGWYGRYDSGHHYRPGRPPWRPGYRPRPEHPVYRPPVKPMPAQPTQNNAQLMRPIIPRTR
jgi:hypothetical protein